MEQIDRQIAKLVGYGVHTGLTDIADVRYTVNAILELLQMDAPAGGEPIAYEDTGEEELEGVLNALTDYACAHGLTGGDSVTYRDLFDTRLMAALMPRPSEVLRRFGEEYRKGPQNATDYYYKLSCDSNYIRRYRIKRDLKWKTQTPYGEIDITVNLSKPEKDPKAIAAAKLQKQTGYPKCLLCKENEGYAGRVNHPARQNHRIIPLTLAGDEWYMQYSPYVYYNEHCIVFSGSHSPMVIHEKTFRLLFDFVRQFPHYIIGSNADLPIVGGSILTHEHFQGGGYRFALNRAPLERTFTPAGYGDVTCGVVKWPMSVIRLTGKDPERLTALASHILSAWRAYSDPDAFVYAETDGEKHNTITPIACRVGDDYVLDLVLRNNITTEEHPLGVFHPHAELHHIKKENIGLIEVMGLAVLPARLKDEMAALRSAILSGADFSADPAIGKHAAWVAEFKPRYDRIDESNIDGILQDEIGHVFARVLADAGVYKRTPEGQAAFDRFLATL